MKDRKLEVYLGDRKVGTLAETTDCRIAFAYSEEWLDNLIMHDSDTVCPHG